MIGQPIGREDKTLTAMRRLLLPLTAALLVAIAACRSSAPPAKVEPPVRALIGSTRSEPRSFNRYAGSDFATETITLLTQAKLVRIDRRTQELQPWLAESWTASPDGRTFTLALGRGIEFSDGTPFTAADVVFAFQAIYSPGCRLGQSVRVDGKPLQVTAIDDHTVKVVFPGPFGPGLRLLDNVPILPRHKLQAALDAGTLLEAWGPATPVSEIVGLGPFVVKEYQPGQRLVFHRNPRYWRKAPDGSPLPALDRLTLEIVPDQNAELLRLQSGQVDFTQTEIRPDDYATLKKAADAGKVRLLDIGVGLDADSFWINLGKGAAKRPWLSKVELRQAISHAVDRRAFADTVYLGAAVPVHGLITPANTRWYSPDLPKFDYDPAKAKALLASIGLKDRNNDGLLEEASGEVARFTLLTSKSRTSLERGAAFLRDEMKKVGLTVDVVSLEVGALIDRIERGDYEAAYFIFLTTDLDPALNLDLWLSSGPSHVWHPSQKTPATDWERQVDQLMLRQVATVDHAERKALFDRAQAIVAEHAPVIQFAAPRLFVAVSPRVEGATPSLLRPTLLWNPETLTTRPVAGSR